MRFSLSKTDALWQWRFIQEEKSTDAFAATSCMDSGLVATGGQLHGLTFPRTLHPWWSQKEVEAAEPSQQSSQLGYLN
jgi:hypothetical protein